MNEEIKKIKMIKNNQINAENIIYCLNKTLNAKKINIKINNELSNKYNLIVLTYIKNKKTKNLFYQPLEVISSDESFDEFYNDLINLNDYSVSCVPHTKSASNITEIPKSWYPQYESSKPGHISIIHNLVYYKWKDNIDNIDNIDVFDMATDLFIRMAQTQYLPNGNKRNAVLITSSFLSFFSFYTLRSQYYLEFTFFQIWIRISKIAATKYMWKEHENEFGEKELIAYENEKLSDEKLFKLIKKELKYMSYFKIM